MNIIRYKKVNMDITLYMFIRDLKDDGAGCTGFPYSFTRNQ